MNKPKCTCCRLVDSEKCNVRALYEIKFDGRHIGYACGIHARAYTEKSLSPLSNRRDILWQDRKNIL